MIITYLVQAVLVTIYLSVLLSIHFDKIPKKLKRKHFISRTALAVQHSTSTFLGASFVFSIAMLLATIVSFGRLTQHRLPGTSLLTWALGTLMPICSILPVVQLQLVASHMLRRWKGRTALWAVLYVLLTIVLGLSTNISRSMRELSMYIYRWQDECFEYYTLISMAYVGWAFAGTLMSGMTCFFIGSASSYLFRRPPKLLGPAVISTFWVVKHRFVVSFDVVLPRFHAQRSDPDSRARWGQQQRQRMVFRSGTGTRDVGAGVGTIWIFVVGKANGGFERATDGAIRSGRSLERNQGLRTDS